MAIDPEREILIALRDVPNVKWIPTRRKGRLNVSTCYRWALHGLRGVKLEVLQFGGEKFTSERALKQFFGELASGRKEETAKEVIGKPNREVNLSQVRQELDNLGL